MPPSFAMQDEMTQDEIDAILKSAKGNTDAGGASESAQGDVNAPDGTTAQNAGLTSNAAAGETAQSAAVGQNDSSQTAPFGRTSEERSEDQQVDKNNINFLLDVPLNVSVELGRTKMAIKDMLQLGPGSVIELDKLIGEPVDLLVNDRPIARGEVVVFDENFGIRITDILNPEERIKSLR